MALAKLADPASGRSAGGRPPAAAPPILPQRLESLVAALPPDLSARETVERILAGLEEYLAGAEAGDDVTVMALRVLPA